MSFEIKYGAENVPVKNGMPKDIEVPEFITQQQEEVLAQPVAHEEMYESNPELEETPVVVTPKESAPQESWKILREKAERAERRAVELEAALLEASSKKQQQEPDEDLGFSIDEDALAEGKHLNKVSKKIQKLESQLRQYEQQTAATAIENRLKSQYPDFDSIVSAENLSNLRVAYPELANSINSTADLYSKAVSAYTMIKKLGIASPQEDTFQQEKAIAQRNAAKPKSLASISPQQGDSPMSRANAFANGDINDDLKKQLWKEMNQYRK